MTDAARPNVVKSLSASAEQGSGVREPDFRASVSLGFTVTAAILGHSPHKAYRIDSDTTISISHRVRLAQTLEKRLGVSRDTWIVCKSHYTAPDVRELYCL